MKRRILFLFLLNVHFIFICETQSQYGFEPKDIDGNILYTFPSTFSNQLHIALRIPDNQKVKLEIFDDSGKKVKTLLNSKFKDQYSHIVWDGKRRKGKLVPNGLYFIKLSYAGSQYSRNITKISKLNTTKIMGLSLTDNGKTWNYFKNGMMRERHSGDGDNLWRTSLAYVAYKNYTLLQGMLACTKWITPDHVRYYRSTEQNDEDVSRDQITMFLVAMSLNGHDVSKYIKSTKWKISKRYSLDPDMWLWMRALKGKKLNKILFFLYEIPIAKIYQLFNRTGISKLRFPSYAIHLFAWQIYSLNSDSRLKRILSDIVVDMADEENYLVQLLLGYDVPKSDIDSVIPQTDFIWQRFRNDSPNIRPLTPEEAEFNTLDVDVLKEIYRTNPIE